MRKKLFTFLLAIVASLGTLFAASGTCGPNLTWDLTDGVLTISGTGAMDYELYSAPWSDSRASIQSVVIEEGVTTIGAYAFSHCLNLTSVTLPEGLTTIGRYAFEECNSLTSIDIPNSVIIIPTAESAFWDCTNLTAINVASNNTNFCSIEGVLFSKDKTKILTYPQGKHGSYTIPNSVTIIGWSAFQGCSGLTSVTLPNSVTSIGDYAFSGCTGLTSVTIPNSVTSIGIAAFEGCSALASVTIPNSVTEIESYTFRNCKISSINFLGTLEEWCNREWNIENLLGGDTNQLYQLFINGILQEDIVIPSSVTYISGTFYNCSSLTSVRMDEGVMFIWGRAFYNCIALTSIDFPNSITFIEKNAFAGCTNLPIIDNIRYADTYLVEVIDNSLPVFSIRKGTKWIPSTAFDGCYNLTSMTIPESVIEIGYAAFTMCPSLKTVIFKPVVPPTIINYDIFDKENNVKIVVPFGTLDTYKTEYSWMLKHHTFHVVSKNPNLINMPTSISLTFEEGEMQHIASYGIEEGAEFAGNVIEYIGLEPNSEYANMPFFIKTIEGDYDTIHYSFTTPALTLTTKPSKAVSATTAILLAETNMSDAEVSCGFEYKRNDAPADMAGTKVFCPVASGQMAGRLKNLKDDVYYKYRAFYQSKSGNMYYGDWQYIFTGDNAVEFDPILYTYTASVVTETGATLSGYALAGSEDFTEQGFEYWAESRTNSGANAPHRMPAGLNEHFFAQANGIKMTVTLTNLDEGTVYKYRAYGKVGNQYYYGSEQTFTTQGEWQEGQGIEEVPSDKVPSTKAQKILRNGQIYILYKDQMYNVQGQKVK